MCIRDRRLRVVGPDNVTVESMSVQKIAVTIDDLVSVKKPVETQIINQNSDDSEPYIVQLSQDAVVVELSLIHIFTRKNLSIRAGQFGR